MSGKLKLSVVVARPFPNGEETLQKAEPDPEPRKGTRPPIDGKSIDPVQSQSLFLQQALHKEDQIFGMLKAAARPGLPDPAIPSAQGHAQDRT